MDITPLVPKGKQTITGYGEGKFYINEEAREGSLLVFPDAVFPWNVKEAREISAGDFDVVLEQSDSIEVLLLGVGKEFASVSYELRKIFEQKGIALEAMDTGAACRTYNVLLTEGRLVAAALIAI